MYRALERSKESRNPMSQVSQELPDIIHDVRSRRWILYHPPDQEGDSEPPYDCL
jgi:hypothetical protein